MQECRELQVQLNENVNKIQAQVRSHEGDAIKGFAWPLRQDGILVAGPGAVVICRGYGYLVH